MVNRCCIKKCNGKNKKVSVFKVPTDEKLYQKWARALSQVGEILTKNSFICENHFEENDIVKEKVNKDENGKIIFQVNKLLNSC